MPNFTNFFDWTKILIVTPQNLVKKNGGYNKSKAKQNLQLNVQQAHRNDWLSVHLLLLSLFPSMTYYVWHDHDLLFIYLMLYLNIYLMPLDEVGLIVDNIP